MAELTTKAPPRATAKERQRRAEALRLYRADERVKSMAVAGEVAYLREQLRLAARLTARLASKSDVEELAQLVVDELHETSSRNVPRPLSGSRSTVHFDAECASAKEAPFVVSSPTIMHHPFTHDTDVSTVPAGAGLDSTDQPVPFHRSTSGE